MRALPFGTRLRIGMAVGDGRVEVEIRSHNEYSIASELAGFGRRRGGRTARGARSGSPPSPSELVALYRGTAAAANSAIDVKRHVGDTSPDGVAVAPLPPLS